MSDNGKQHVDVHFSCNTDALMPEIPYVQDVLYMLRLTNMDDFFRVSMAANPVYIKNVALVAWHVAEQVLGVDHYDDVQTRKIIAQVILDLTPPDFNCLFSQALLQASDLVTGNPARDKVTDHLALLHACSCKCCKEIVSKFVQ